MKNNEYWTKRFKLLEIYKHKRAELTVNEIDAIYKSAQRELEKEISVWYQRFAENNKISMQEAKIWLTTRELSELKWDVRQYIKYGRENALNQKWIKQLENASARFHISRIEALKINTQNIVEKLYGNQSDIIDTLMKQQYRDGFYHTAFEIQRGINIGWDISAINESKMNGVLSKPWLPDGKTFSMRIWENQLKLLDVIHKTLIQDFMIGNTPDESIKTIVKEMNTSRVNAGRIVMTESAYFSSISQRDAYKKVMVDEYEIVATLDNRTSKLCQSLDGVVQDISVYEPGVTANPFHVNCRTTTAPYIDGEIGERIARDPETGKTYYVPSNMKYSEWYDKYVINKENLIHS